MTMQDDLAARLVADATINAITGSRVSWFGFQRGDSGGQIALRTITPGREWNHEGPDWLDRPRVRFDLRGTSATQVYALKAAVLAEMEEEATVGGTKFHPAMLDAEREIDLGEQEGGAVLFQLQLEFLFHHEES